MPDSSGENIFRRSPTVKIEGRNKSNALYKTRYNAYVKITSTAGGTLPQPGTTFNNTYSSGKPKVVLNSVTIYEGQEYGSLLQAEVQFTCYTKGAFDELQKQFLILRDGDLPVKVDIEFGFVGATFSNAEGSVKGLMIYNFGYQLSKDNAYVCTFKAMGSAKLADEIGISATNRISSLELEYQDLSEEAFQTIPVVTVPEFIKSIAQGEGFKATFELEPEFIANPYGLTGHIAIINHPSNYVPDGEVTQIIYAVLQTIGLAGSDDSSKLIYCSLEYLISIINKYIKPMDGEIGNIQFVCNSTVTSGAYLKGVCSADPFNILLVGPEQGDYGSESGLDIEEYILTREIPGEPNAIDGETYDYSKIFLSYKYLGTKQWGATSNVNNTPEAAADPNDKPAEIKFTVGTLLNSIFEDIANNTGGAVKLMTYVDPKDPNKVLIIPTNESTTSAIKPVRFDPLNGDGITRECSISCNPASADAYAIAAGPNTVQADTVKATNGEASTEADLDAIRTEIAEIQKKTMALSQYTQDQVSALRDALTRLVTACSGKEVSEGKIPITAAQWPLSLDITLDGIFGFRFGDVVETTFLPDTYLKSGLSAAFIVQRVVHTIANNEWTTKLETVCDLVNKA